MSYNEDADEDDKRRKYRGSTLGQTLGQSLLALTKEGKLTKKEAVRLLELFDKSINARVKGASEAVESASMEGELEHYNCINGLWHLRVKNVRTTLPHVTNISTLTVLAEEIPRRTKRKV